MLKLLVLTYALLGSGPAASSSPYYVTRSGVLVYDPQHFSNAAEVQRWIDLTIEHAPPDPSGTLNFADRLRGSTLIIDPNIEKASACTVEPGYIVIGCTLPRTKNMWIAVHPCGTPNPSAGILAHELGHLLGYGHGYAPWYSGERMEVLIDSLVCGTAEVR